VVDSDLDVYREIARSRRVWDASGTHATFPWSDYGHEAQKVPVVIVIVIALEISIKTRAPHAVRRNWIRLAVRAGSRQQRDDGQTGQQR
jgi:hypothetical protein